MHFTAIKSPVAAMFGQMAKQQLFRVDIDSDLLWKTYLESFPEGANPVFETNTEHDCSCCRQFIRAVGNIVAIVDGQLQSIWDVQIPSEPGYQVVANALSKLVKSGKIKDVFLHFERTAGVDKTFAQLKSGASRTFNHFFVNIPAHFVMKGADIPSSLAKPRETKNVLLRGLAELTTESIDIVLDLIDQNSLYRGEEHKFAVTTFQKLKRDFDKLQDDDAREQFAWIQATSKDIPESVARIRNTAIGTLLIDLSEGKELDYAVSAFEKKVAPENYKRPTALVTAAMIAKAKETITELGLTSALERRYANVNDITVNDLLFVDRNTKKAGGGDVFDTLAASVAIKPKSFDKVEEVPIEKFMSDILPTVKSLEVLFENRHNRNLVSLVAPVDPTASEMFKWPNRFSWSYNGEIADSDIRREVQAKGGRVDGVFRFSHSWNHAKRNASLMDLHVFMPGNNAKAENEIHDDYGNDQRVGWNRRNHPASGGIQDVDYTAPAPTGYVPVENITFPSLDRMPEGRYLCKIHNWQLRQPTEGGFKAEIEFGGELFQYDYDKPMKNKEWVVVAEVQLKNDNFSIKHFLPLSDSVVKTSWGIATSNFHKVNAVMLSPNHWDDKAVGNKHYFFMLEGCKNDGTARGFFNEFLKEEMTPHRKVLEMVGAKMKLDSADQQLSGLGFSSTQRNTLICRVKGSFNRFIRVVF